MQSHNGSRYYGSINRSTWHCPYMQHFVCFDCHYGWKSYSYKTKCSHCATPGRCVGVDCRVPAKSDKKGWARLHHLVKVDHVRFELLDCETLCCEKHYNPKSGASSLVSEESLCCTNFWEAFDSDWRAK